ncbi:Outer membrane protein transport protein (OMPP1/FadL/TodX) [Flavobacterium flevense]|uniref:Transporter n=1 Tax=Flavobacterium flevense TaxID=983 RepID=A0A4Y4AUN6_9FLAO|nr:outer membrane protein transport protein [Flavobacterium flevense]GEC71925.1 transporter [Flavobacterium flevense]SHL81954.1 Outer membrane protein transport protein (OMPP1/FadL/TodX) [Flavobacterium flevense]
MKKYLYLILAGFTFSAVQSQELVDALRYSQDNPNGSARYRAMSGAFGALGGDLSSLNVNPAGSAVFNNNQLAFSFSNVDTKNKSNYFGTNMTGKDNSFDINQAGAVFVFNNRSQSNWTKIALAINYEQTNNFNNAIISAGTNPTNSVGDYFLYYANGDSRRNLAAVPLGTIRNFDYYQLDYVKQQAFLGYEGYLINPVTEDDNNTQYTTNVPAGGNYYQENTITSEGYNGKLSFNAATSYKDKLYLGLTLNSHFTDFRQNTLFYEDNDNANNNIVDLINTSFENEIYTYGSGFSFQLGAIAKLNEEVRLGLSYESPTWNKFNDEVRQNLFSTIQNYENNNNPNEEVINPDSFQTTIYDTYKLKTPGKITGSIAYVFNKKGLISLDYGYKDYSSIEYSMERDTRNPYINSDISEQLRGASEIRLGGEYKIERLSLRAGYRFEGSPYKDKTTVGDLNGFSAGLGYNFGGTKVDLSYAYAKRNSQQGFFSQGFKDGASIDAINNSVSLSLLFEL